MELNTHLLQMVKLGFVPPGGGGDPAAGGMPPGGDPAAAGQPPMDPAAAGGAPPGAPPAQPAGFDPMLMQQMIQQQVQQAMMAAGGGAPGMAGGSPGMMGGKPKGAGKAPDETAQQLYKLNMLLMAMAKHMNMPIPDEMFLGPPPGMEMQQAMAQPPADPNAQPGQDPNAAAAQGQQPINVMPSLAMPQAPMPKAASEDDAVAAELVRSFGSTFAVVDTPEKPMVEVQVPPWANLGESDKVAAVAPDRSGIQSRAQALVELLRAGQRA